jgi:hypothetical protein
MRRWVLPAAATAAAAFSAWAAWSSSHAANATLTLAREERAARIEREDTIDYHQLSAELRNPDRLRVDKQLRTRFKAFTSPQATLVANARSIYQAGRKHGKEDEEATRHLNEWYFGPVHKMVQLGFRNKGPEAAFGVDLAAAPTLLYLCMWTMGTTGDGVDHRALLDHYNRTAGMARRCKTEYVRLQAEKQLLGKEEATALFESCAA